MFDVYDRVLDKGVLVDPPARVAMAGAFELERRGLKVVVIVSETPFSNRGDPDE